MSYAIVESGKVVNLIEWDGEAELAGLAPVQIPEGATVHIGYSYDGKAFTAPAVVAPVLTAAEAIALYEGALRVALDAGAQAWGYDSIVSAASYAASTVAQFAAEAKALIAWRDESWLAAETLEAAVKAGTAAMPATAAAFVAMMPAAPARPTAPA